MFFSFLLELNNTKTTLFFCLSITKSGITMVSKNDRVLDNNVKLFFFSDFQPTVIALHCRHLYV